MLRMSGAALASGLLAACSPASRETPASRVATPVLPPDTHILSKLRPGHPRLLLFPSDIERVRGLISADDTAREYHDALVKLGEELLDTPPVEYELADADGLLGVSRDVLDRTYTLGLLFLLDGDQRWAERATRELRMVAAFHDWNPGHFLDTAEMAHAVAIGYDWLYAALSPTDRATFKAALVEKALRPAQEAYIADAWWSRDPSNWNNVCNGGVAVAALAVADEEQTLASFVLSEALKGLPHALASYAPDGAWPEGPSYWSYATRYTVVVLAALQSALGGDFGLADSPGLAGTGRFRLQVVGPSGAYFNFADAEEKVGDDPALFWLAGRYRQPDLALAGRRSAAARPSARDLLWYRADGRDADLARLPLDEHFTGAGLAIFRSSWGDSDAIYLGFKAGDNRVSHAHIDLGTFVLDALGQRWAIDLGRDGYSLSGYFGLKRPTYYRVRTEGHNTLTFGGENQRLDAVAPIVEFQSSPSFAFAVADLSAAYQKAGVTNARRGVALFDSRQRVLVQDEIESPHALEPVWAMHTRAGVRLDGDSARLEQDGAVLSARILSPQGVRFEVEPVDLPKPQKSTEGISKLIVRAPAATSTRISVLLSPGVPDAGTADLLPLEQWERLGPK
jgi:hypothetical protein